jgi:hypothetical protein
LPPGAMCPPDLSGACWVLPDTCPAPGMPGPPMPPFHDCAMPMGVGTCVNACEAIRSGRPHERCL